MTVSAPSDSARLPLAWLWGALAVAALLLLVRLGAAPVSNDEAVYLRVVHATLGDLFTWLREDNYPPLYFLGLHVWVKVWGLEPAAARLSSVPFALATIVLFTFWTRQFLTSKEARLALVLLVLSPLLLLLWRTVKYFALFNALSLLCTMLVWRLVIAEPRRVGRDAMLLFLSGTVLLWIHYLGVVVLGSLGVWALWDWIRTRRREAMWSTAALAAAGLTFIPQVLHLLVRMQANATTNGAQEAVPGTLRALAVQLGYTAFAFPLGHTLEAAHVILALLGMGGFWLLAVAGCASAFRKDESASIRTRTLRFVLCMAILQGTGAFLAMWFFLRGLPDMYVSERLSMVLPLVLILAAAGAALLPRWGAALAGAALAVPVMLSLFNLYTLRENNAWDYLIPWPQIREHVENRRSGDVPAIVVFDNWHLGSRGWYYFRDSGVQLVEIRQPGESGHLRDVLAALPAEATIFLIRSVRDTSPRNMADAAEAILRERPQPPVGPRLFVQDSPAMRRLKALLRRGTGVAETTGKVALLEFPPQDQHRTLMPDAQHPHTGDR